jgi:hypothetical protein
MKAKSKSGVPNSALSVRQPYAEQIMSGSKKIEYRSRATSFPKRIYIYSSQTLTSREKQAYKKMHKEPGDFPVGVLIDNNIVIKFGRLK